MPNEVPDPLPPASIEGAEPLLFGTYPGGGRKLLARRAGDNCRKGYGLQLQRLTGQTTCAYCGLSLITTYEQWLGPIALLAGGRPAPDTDGQLHSLVPACLIRLMPR